MSDTPIRHILFLTVLLFVILSSGSLQCALNCYDRATQYSCNVSQVADCHPLAVEEPASSLLSSFCHHGRSTEQANQEPMLLGISSAQVLALFSSKAYSPQYRSAEPFEQQFMVLALTPHQDAFFPPLSQSQKQLRSTILLM